MGISRAFYGKLIISESLYVQSIYKLCMVRRNDTYASTMRAEGLSTAMPGSVDSVSV